MTSSNKRLKLSPAGDSAKVATSTVFDGLNDDALRAILVRTCAADHNSLRQTCKRFCRILNSFSFRQERGVLGYAEVQGVELRPPFQQYKEDFCGAIFDEEEEREPQEDDATFQRDYDELGHKGEYGNHNLSGFKVLVDGQEIFMERFSVHLLPRRRTDAFFEMCDSLSGTICSLGTTFFDTLGSLRLPSLKAAVPANDRRPLLYISGFELPKEYRTLASIVGPMILQSLLTKTPLLKDRWSIAMYIPSDKAQFTAQDKDQSYKMPTTTLSAQEEKEKKAWDDRSEALTLQDMRQFFRAGFCQVSDVSLTEDSDYYVYATPDHLHDATGAAKPILTEQEALQIEILKLLPDPPARNMQEKALFELMRGKCVSRQCSVSKIKDLQKPLREIEEHTFQQSFRMMDEMTQRIRRSLEMVQSCKRAIEEQHSQVLSQIDGTPIEVQIEILEQTYNRLHDPNNPHQPPIRPRPLTVDAVFGPHQRQINDSIEQAREMIRYTEDETERKLRENASKLVSEEKEKLQKLAAEVEQELQGFLTSNTAGSMDKTQLIIKSDAIHVCVFSMSQPYVQLLLDLLPPNKKTKALNSPDHNGATPLVLAALAYGSSWNDFGETVRHEMIEFLIQQGADKNAQNRRGLTALGLLRESRRSDQIRDIIFGSAGGRGPRENEGDELETLLMPALGPSPADQAIMEDYPEGEMMIGDPIALFYDDVLYDQVMAEGMRSDEDVDDTEYE